MLLKPRPRSFFIALLALLVILTGFVPPVEAQRSLNLIRDEEIETYLREWTKDVVAAAGLSQDQVNIILVQSSDINAFVAGGANVFIYTGLIQKTDNPGEVIAVIAHELGHIAGGHLTRTREEMSNASFETMIGAVLGLGAAIATGDSGAAAAGMAIGSSNAMNSYLSFSRVQESSADQAGYRFMENAQLNPTGILTFLQKIQNEELLPTSQQSQFMRTHPLSDSRISALQSRVESSPYKAKAYPTAWNDEYNRTKAKLSGFVTPQRVIYDYKSSDNSIPAQYARAIAAYRMSHVQEALKLTDGLLAKEPNNPYFLELKGQMLYEFGRIKESLGPYEKAVALKPSAGLIRIAYGNALIDTANKSPAVLKRAIEELKRAQIDEPRSARVKRLLATAYGQMGDETRARVYLAEESLMQGKRDQAKSMAKSTLSQLPPNSPEYLRAQDVISSVDGYRVKD